MRTSIRQLDEVATDTVCNYVNTVLQYFSLELVANMDCITPVHFAVRKKVSTSGSDNIDVNRDAELDQVSIVAHR